MAFPAYSYPGYQSPYYPQPIPDQMRQPQMMQPVPPVQPGNVNGINGANGSNGILWVGSKMEADNYLIAPNSAVALWDANNPVIYLRQADGTGKPTTKVYDLVERTDDRPPKQETPQIDLSQYMTRDQVEEIIEDRLEDRLNDLLTERLKKPAKGSQRKEND